MADRQMPQTKAYRVVGVAAIYQQPTQALNSEGEVTYVMTPTLGTRGETVELIDFEAQRLAALGAVKPADEQRSYDEMGDDELAAETLSRGIDVVGSAVDGSVRREDSINALVMFDQGATAGITRGTTTVPGGVALSAGGTSDVERTERTAEAPATLTDPTAPGFDPAELDVNALAEHIKAEGLNAEATVTLAKNDPELAQKVLEAEQQVTGRDARATVEARLQRIINQAESPEDPEAGLSDEQTGG